MSKLRVKIFNHCTTDIKPYNETQINAWLENNPDIELIKLVQSESMAALSDNQVERNLTITVFYRESGGSGEEEGNFL